MAKSKGKRHKRRARRSPERTVENRARQREKRFRLNFPEGLALLPNIRSYDNNRKKLEKIKKPRRLIIRDKPNVRINRKNEFRDNVNFIAGTESFYPNSYVRKVCKDRHKRREVLFIKRKAGKGRSGPKKRRYTDKSKVRC